MTRLIIPFRKVMNAIILMTFLFRLALAAEISIFALQGPGQATVVIDDKGHVAHLIDLGKGGDGDKLELDGKPILEALREKGIERITITCSHPHADHHGGFRKMLSTRSNFSAEGKKLFGDKIPVIESSMPQVNSLAAILKNTVAGLGIIVEVRAPSGKDTYKGFSSPDSEVFLETIPYKTVQAAGVHGRSVITKTTLANRHVHLDFDDADSNVIHEVAAHLKAEGAKIDSFIVPHHGSAAHDVEAILELDPKTAIISVDPLNRYGHPAPEILLKLMERLPKDQILFTGARAGERIVIKPEGIAYAPYTAASYDSFALFVLPSMVRATGKRAPDMENAYGALWNKISGDDSEPPPPPAVVKANPRPPKTPSGGSGAVAEQIAANGTMHGEAFEAGRAQFGFVKAQYADQQKVFPRAEAPADGNRVQALYATLSAGDKQAVLRRLEQMSTSVDPKTKLLVSYLTEYGVPDVLRPAETKPMPVRAPAPAPTRAGTAGNPDKGGMVDLKGDKVFMGSNAQYLVGGIVKKCPTGLCLVANSGIAGSAISFRLPFGESALAAAVWDRTWRRGLDQLYLSIDPTTHFLKDESPDVPSDKLHFGPTLPATWENNRVVTHGDIDRSIIGKILWDSDVAFKSESLGFNVLTGARPTGATTRDISVDEDAASAGIVAGRAASIPRAARWCRMFWESGEQKVVADTLNARVRLDGKAVVAQGEAMQLKDGQLVEFPAGAWCEDAKQVARTLEGRANAPTTFGTLKQLRDLAEMQNFWRWAREHTVSTSYDVKTDFEKLAQADNKETVPVFTSGVKSSEPVLTQYRRKVGFEESQILHVRLGDVEVVKRCVGPRWEQVKLNLEAQGVRPNSDGAFTGKDTFTVLDREMARFSSDVAGCAGGQSLPAKFERTKRIGDDEPERGVFGFESHLQPVEIHGGILLGKSSKVLRDIVQASGTLDDIEGHALFRKEGKNLHFWAASREGEEGELTEHVEIQEAALVEVYPSDGTINFLVRANPHSLLRHELRQRRSPVLDRGVEWMGVYPAPGQPAYWQKAAWPCAGQEADCAWVSDVSRNQLDQYLTASEHGLDGLIDYEKADDSLWVLRLDVERVRDSLLALASNGHEKDADTLASVARSLAWWGFTYDAEEMAGRSQDLDREASDAEDYTAAFLATDLPEFQLDALSLQLAFENDDLLDERANAEKVLNSLAAYERKLKRLPVAGSAEIWEEMSAICESIDASEATAEVKNKLVEAAARYATAAHVSRVLVE